MNQRRQSSYSSADAATDVYSVDRWYIFNGALAVGTENLTLTHNANTNGCGFEQKNENVLVGKTVTLSVLDAGGNIYSVSGVATNNGSLTVDIDTNWYAKVYFYSTYTQMRLYSTTSNAIISVRAIKLELGSVSTLANDEAPDYATELLKCQRYYQVYTEHIMTGYANSAKQLRVSNGLFAPMRANPTFSITDVYYVEGEGSEIANPSISSIAALNTGRITFNFENSILTTKKIYAIQIGFTLSADL